MRRTVFSLVIATFWLAQVRAATGVWPANEWAQAAPGEAGLSESRLAEARDYALTAGGSGLIVHRGKVVMQWGDRVKLYDIKSATKSIGATALGIAIDDGRIGLDSPAAQYFPGLGTPPEANKDTGWLAAITIRQLATHSAGFEKPGGFGKLLAKPGTKWIYSDGGPNWLADCITLVYNRDIEDLMFERVFEPIGITRADLRWRRNSYRPQQLDGVTRREFGAGVHANVNALARIGYLYLREGNWNGKRVLSREFIQSATRPMMELSGLPEGEADHGNASEHYGLLWWNNADGTLAQVPRDAYWAWGLYDSLIVVIPSLDIVAVRGGENGKQWARVAGAGHYEVLKPFLQPIVSSTRAATTEVQLPYARSRIITNIEWDDPTNIVRKARGSDNWPITWGADDALYTAFGDGTGFEPFVEKKLSLGFARIEGGPENFRGINIRADAEKIGDGAKGPKASGMLMVDGVLYMLARNLTNSQLAWSNDQGKTWTWAQWKFTIGFGCPTFVNFGRNYEGARDDYVYIFTSGSPTAYQASDFMVLARVHKSRIREQEAYEFFGGLNASAQPYWTPRIEERRPVFVHPRSCYRSTVSYHPVLKRYLWVQTLPQSADEPGPRFQGGFGVFEAPEPWGPWSTAYYTTDWDVGPGETASFPTKWMSKDGRTVYLVFSGDDHFSVRRGTLIRGSSQ